MNPTSPKGVKAWGEGPLRPKEFPRHRDTLGQIRASTTRPAKALPSTWRGPVQNQSVAKMIWTAAEVVEGEKVFDFAALFFYLILWPSYQVVINLLTVSSAKRQNSSVGKGCNINIYF